MMRSTVIREIREFCEDNNRQPPAPMRSVPARPELTHWSAADPALEIEADPAVELRGPSGRTCYLQRVVYDIRYLLRLDNGTEFERGEAPDISFALEVARVWLGGGGLDDLPKPRKYWL
jgi:hypothetical protein